MAVDVEFFMNGLPHDRHEALAVILRKSDRLDRSNQDDCRIAVLILRKMTANIPDLFVEEDDKHSWSETLSVYRNEIRRFLYENDTKKLEETVDEQIELWLSEAESKSFGYAKLNASEKELVITHIEKIRLLIDESSLSQSKKIKLFNRLSSLYNEILRDNTKTDDFFAFMGDLAFTVGEMAQKAKPAIDEFKAIMRIVMGGRARKEGVLLPTEDDLPQLPAPEHSEGE